MFSGLSKWTDRLDEEFLKDISTDDGRSQKIKKLRRSRQSFLIVTFVLGFIIIVFFFWGCKQKETKTEAKADNWMFISWQTGTQVFTIINGMDSIRL